MSRVDVSRLAVASIFCMTLALAAIPAQAQTYTVLYDNPGAPGVGNPSAQAIAQGRDGDLYTTSTYGGTDYGTFFKFTPSGTVTVENDTGIGYFVASGVTLGTDGNFYGTDQDGGPSGGGCGFAGCGQIYKVTPAGVETVLYNFTNTAKDGYDPQSAPVEATNGKFYGTTPYSAGNYISVAYSITSTGTFSTVHVFTNAEGQDVFAGFVQGTDGNLYGVAANQGAKTYGTIFRMTTAGAVTVLHSFDDADGNYPYRPLLQASDGNFYGTTAYGGAHGAGVVFRITPSGTYTVLHNFDPAAGEGNGPSSSLTQATDGKLYGVTFYGGGAANDGTIYSITTGGTFTTLHSFCRVSGCADGSNPNSPLKQNTNGVLYGTSYYGGENNHNNGVIYSLNIGAKPFISLAATSGNVGSTIGIFGQGFSSASVVKFNGVAATKITLTGTTFITATVPAGATDGKVTVTTGTTTLTSNKTFIVHNSWSKGKAMPIATFASASGSISGKIYVISGDRTQGGAPVSDNQVFNTATNSWTTAAAIPTPVSGPASAVVGGLLYVIGGYEGTSGTPSNLVQIYNPATNKWTTGKAMPTPRGSIAAAVDGNAIYVIGGNGSTLRLANVEKYVPSTNTWTEEAPLPKGKSEPSAGLLGTTIVAAGGYTTSGDTGDNEGYNVSTNKWSARTADPTPRNASCYGALSGQFYVAGGVDANPKTTTTVHVNESFSATTNKWTTQLPMPSAALWQASAIANGQLYCIGGQSSFQGAVIGNVQIYQP